MNDEIKEDLRNVAIGAGIAWLLMALGKLIYRYPNGYFVFCGIMVITTWLNPDRIHATAGISGLFVFWSLVNGIVMMVYGRHVRPITSISTFADEGSRHFRTVFTVIGALVCLFLGSSMEDATSLLNLAGAGLVFLIIGVLLTMAIVRHHVEMENCYGANVTLMKAGAFGLLCLTLVSAFYNYVSPPHIEVSAITASPAAIVASPRAVTASPPSAVANPDHSGVVAAGTVAPNQSEIDSAERMEVSMNIYRLGKAHVMEALKQCFGDTGVPSQTSWRVDADSIVTLNDPTRWCKYNIATKQALAHDL